MWRFLRGGAPPTLFRKLHPFRFCADTLPLKIKGKLGISPDMFIFKEYLYVGAWKTSHVCFFFLLERIVFQFVQKRNHPGKPERFIFELNKIIIIQADILLDNNDEM